MRSIDSVYNICECVHKVSTDQSEAEMDNRSVDVVSEGSDGLEMAMKLIWPNAHGGKASHYLIAKYRESTKYYSSEGETRSHSSNLVEDEKGCPTLILLWYGEGKALPLPFALGLDGAIAFVTEWLKSVDYGSQPDHDGSNHKGWRVFNESWGHVAGYHGAIVAIQPAWAMYGK